MKQESNDRKINQDNGSKVGVGIAIGLAIGTGLGVVFGLAWDNFALGISIGVGTGLAIGSAIGATLDQQNTDKDKPYGGYINQFDKACPASFAGHSVLPLQWINVIAGLSAGYSDMAE